jgi:hypothetical protein
MPPIEELQKESKEVTQKERIQELEDKIGELRELFINPIIRGAEVTAKLDLSSMGTTTDKIKFIPDANDPTSGGGAATGRIAIDIGGSTVYLAYY